MKKIIKNSFTFLILNLFFITSSENLEIFENTEEIETNRACNNGSCSINSSCSSCNSCNTSCNTACSTIGCDLPKSGCFSFDQFGNLCRQGNPCDFSVMSNFTSLLPNNRITFTITLSNLCQIISKVYAVNNTSNNMTITKSGNVITITYTQNVSATPDKICFIVSGNTTLAQN